MSRFLTNLDTEEIGRERWRLLSPLRYESDIAKAVITVPAGFVTDFASVPRPFWSIFPESGEYDQAATVHDALYTYGGKIAMAANGYPAPSLMTKGQADAIFREALEVLGVPGIGRWFMWSAVKMFGKGNFGKV